MADNFLDRMISVVSPVRAARREKARAAAAAFRQVRMHYDGATTGRRSAGWTTVSTDANAVLLSSRARLRDNARDLVRNSALAARAVAVISNNTVGRGIIPTVAMPGQAGPKVDQLIADLEALLVRHFDTTDCDAVGRQDLYGLQNLIMRTVVESGACLIRRRPRFAADGLPVPFQLQVMEDDFIDSSINGPQTDGTNVVQGVAFTPFGKIAGYWLFPSHPGGSFDISTFRGNRASSFVPASDICHVYATLRPGQIRGVSWFAPVMLQMKDLADFRDAHLMRQKIAACFAAFVKNSTPFDVDPLNPGAPVADPPLESFEPGMIERLGPDEDVQFGTPPQVGDFDPYVKSHQRDIAIGLGISYEALTGDLGGVNFSSGRMGWLEFQRSIDSWRDYMLIPQALAPIGKWFLEAAALVVGRQATSATINWTSPRREMISPAQEVPAVAKAIRSGLTSLSEEQRKLGFEPRALMEEIAADNQRIDDLGMVLDSDPRKTSGAGLTQARPGGTALPQTNIDPNDDAAPEDAAPDFNPDGK
jgi:lambda family phage portal protein